MAIHWPLTTSCFREQLILVVDDDEGVRELFASGFQEAGADVIEAAGGLEGLQCAHRRTPDIVVTDVSMPGLDGIAFARCLRANPETGHVPIIVVSAEASNLEMAEDARKAGCDAILAKPCTMEQLLSVAAAIAERRLALLSAWAGNYTPSTSLIEKETGATHQP